MTSTSFNPIQLSQVENSNNSQPLTIKQGQVFHGTIKKLYPDQTAEVQIGNHKMIAKLDVPLKAGDSYFLQVKNVTPQIELSLISNTTASQSTQEQISKLIESMNLPKTNDVQQLLRFFIKNELPVLKEQLQEAIQWIKNLPEGVSKQEAFLALQKMIDNKMPFQQTVFNALIFGSKTSGILQNIETFTSLIQQEKNLSSEAKMSISSALQKIATPFEGEIGGEVLKRAIQTLQSKNANIEAKQQMLNLLKEANILPKTATLQNWQSGSFTQIKQLANQLSEQNQINNQTNQINQNASQIIQMLSSSKETNFNQTVENVKTWVQNQPLSQEQKGELINLLNQFQNEVKNSKIIESFSKIFHQKLIETFSHATDDLFIADKNSITPKEHLLSLIKQTDLKDAHPQFLNLLKSANDTEQSTIQNILRESEQIVQSHFDGKAIHFALKTILKSLGISYEAALQNSDIETVTNSLKPQLLSLIQHHDISQEVKDSAEVLLSRFNGMQIASNEQNYQQQLIMQVPLQFFGKKIDATVQWNGRMKENGKIDANYARILFYLNMEALQETVVDMQVQNRIVTIQVYNENTHLEQTAEPLKQSLKDGLKEHNYHLSGIFFKQFQSNDQKPKKVQEQPEHLGVDIRI